MESLYLHDISKVFSTMENFLLWNSFPCKLHYETNECCREDKQKFLQEIQDFKPVFWGSGGVKISAKNFKLISKVQVFERKISVVYKADISL